MSLLSTWSKRTRETLLASGARLSHSQVLEVLAAGLGHNSYASFKATDEARLASAHLVVVSAVEMVRRGADLGRELSQEACESAVRALRLAREWPVQHVEELSNFDWIARSRLSDEGHPNKERISEDLGWSIHGLTVLGVQRPRGALAQVERGWCWRGSAHLELFSEDADWNVPCSAEISFEKLGRHLLGKGQITQFAREGEPVKTEFDEVVEGWLSDSTL